MYMLKSNSTGDYFTDFEYWHDGVSTSDNYLDAKRFYTAEDALVMKNEHIYLLEDFSVVKVTLNTTIEKI